MTTSGLIADGISFSTSSGGGAVSILNQVTAEFPGGEASLITGPVGSGKSTLIHLLAALLRPTEGEIRADGKPVSRYTASHRDRWRRVVGIIFQKLELLEGRTVLENVLLPLYPRPGRFRDKVSRAYSAVESVGLSSLASSPISLLSGGERQKTAAARALVTEPRYLLADEPTAHLDDLSIASMLALFEETKSKGAAVVVVSHDPRVAKSAIFDRRYSLDGGRIARDTCWPTP
jgi:putative ABC transport system ATP-binding protein